MTRLTATVTALLSMLAFGCGGDPLVGRWTASTASAPLNFTTTLTLNSDNTVSVTEAGTGACSGSRSYSGLTWSSTATTITFAGTAACTGTIACVVGGAPMNVGCPSDPPQRMTGACTYSLSSGMNSLTLSDCSGQRGVSTIYTRAAN